MSKFQCDGFESLLCSISDKPLDLWSKSVSLDGSIKRIDDDLLNNDKVIEIVGKSERSNNKDSIPTCINCPSSPTDLLNQTLPILVFVLKNLKREGKIEFQLLDQHNFRRQFVLITNTSREKIPKVTPNVAFLPFLLDEGWNYLEIDLRNLCRDVYSTDYHSLLRLIVHPNFRLRRIYLQDRHYGRDETPKELYQALIELYALKKTFKYEDKNCQTQQMQPIVVKKNITSKVVRKKRKKPTDTT